LLTRSRSAEKAVAAVESVLPGDASDVKDLEYALSAAAWNTLMMLHSTMIEVSSCSSSSSKSTGSSSDSNSDDGTSHNDTSDNSNTRNKIGGCVKAAFGVTAAIADSTSNDAEAVAFAEAPPEHGPSASLWSPDRLLFANAVDTAVKACELLNCMLENYMLEHEFARFSLYTISRLVSRCTQQLQPSYHVVRCFSEV
jgi:hypothetical protein